MFVKKSYYVDQPPKILGKIHFMRDIKNGKFEPSGLYARPFSSFWKEFIFQKCGKLSQPRAT